MKKLFVLVLAALVSGFLYGEIKVVSPVSGRWANKQMLVIDTSDGADYFYSLNGENPEISGFAYDGPVLIDMTGEIKLKISRAFEEKSEVNFYVKPSFPEKSTEAERSFIYSFYDSGMLNYFSGNRIDIPSSLRFSFENNAQNFTPGKTISYSEKCSLSRFLPCTVTDGSLYWRFMIRTNPKSTGNFSRRDLPFSIKDWNTIVFENKNLLFKIDSEYWSLPKESRVLDRSVNHVIYWQSLDYKAGNPVEFYNLPPEPKLLSTTNEDGSVSFFLEGDDSYSMSFIPEDNEIYDLYTELNADTFSGDYINESSVVAVYSDSLYQGTMNASFVVDKRLPSYPVFTPNISGFHARGQVDLSVRTSPNNNLFIAVSEPLVLNDSNYSADSPKLKEVDTQKFNFKKYGSEAKIVLSSSEDKPVYYKVKAYSQMGALKSEISEYSVLIDNYSFYFDSEGDSLFSDGSKDHPFVSFDQVWNSLKDYRNVKFMVKGKLRLPDHEIVLPVDCEVTGLGNAVIEMPENASMVIENASLRLSGLRILKPVQGSKNSSQYMIKLVNSSFEQVDCDVFFAGQKNATLIDSNSSEVNVSNSAFTVSSQVYASFIKATDSRVSIDKSKIALVSDTSTGISVRDSELNVEDSSFRITGTLGRACEFYNSTGTLKGNEFSADLKTNTAALLPVYKDEKSRVVESRNYSLGY